MGTLWGGRFTKQTDAVVAEFTNSIHFDHVLAKYDCLASLAHIAVLKKTKLLTISEHRQLEGGLNRILKSIDAGTFMPDFQFEDIHSYIQHLLEKDKRVGKAALKLHTCRSRNDQVTLDTKIYCLDQILGIERQLTILIQNLTELADKNAHIVMPGFTHLQHAIPVALFDQLNAYCEMFRRDEVRLMNIFESIRLYMGAGAVAGTMIPSANYQQKLSVDFHKDIEPPICPVDTVSDRDFVLDMLYAEAMIGQHLSRMAEDLILWATKEFDFIDIDDAFCTGSSLMPNKKNPDVLEMVRGYAGRLYGNLTSVFIMMKGLPLSYNRDMQLDKEPLFESTDLILKELAVVAALVKNIKFKESSIQDQLEDECLYATDIADHLVKNGVAFKDAHRIVGELIKYKIDQNVELRALSEAELHRIHPSLSQDIINRVINPQRSISEKKSIKRGK